MENVKCTLPDCTFCNTIDPTLLVDYFLQESNAIEGVYDPDSLEQARHAWKYLIDQPKIDGGVILKTHKILMLHQPLRPNERGYWRRIQVGVYKGGQLIREAPEWHLVPELIAQWLESVKNAVIVGEVNSTPKLNGETLEEAKEHQTKYNHIKYEHIHPFVDGNGRTGRMFLNWLRLKIGLPLLIIHSENKGDYYEWFK